MASSPCRRSDRGHHVPHDRPLATLVMLGCLAEAPQLASAANVLHVADALTGQSIGARAIAPLPATPAVPASATSATRPASAAAVLIIDVVGQF
jgi:hypothetical protein